MSPRWTGVRSRCVDIEPGFMAAKITLLGFWGRVWLRYVPWVILIDPPSRKRPFVRVRRFTQIREDLRAK